MHALFALLLCVIALPAVALDDATLGSQRMQQLAEPAPDFTLDGAAGDRVQLAALRGHPVIVHFMATWCDACSRELPEIQSLAAQLADTDVTVLVIAIDSDEAAAGIDAFAAGLGITLPVYHAIDGDVSARYWSRGVPVTYLIARDGAIAARALGPRAWTSDAMLALIDQFITE